MKERGFTLVEISLVVLILLILGSAAMPFFAESIELFRLETSASVIDTKVGDARLNALKLNRNVKLVIDTAARTVQVQYEDGGPVNVGAAQTLPSGISFVAPPTPPEITFDPLGWPTTAPETIRLKRDRSGDLRNITISPTGRVTIN
ncbi:GspH/FimT family pseudopilin [Acidobacteria bacterium AH-259-L09]|nr:GspH/FimT family pseudopilin [Acidobacteria bacterium AH-259-L09]